MVQVIVGWDWVKTGRIRRGALDRSGSDSLDKDNYAARAVTWNQDAIETKHLLSIWDLVSHMWWPHMHKDIVNLAEECRECTSYGKNAK